MIFPEMATKGDSTPLAVHFVGRACSRAGLQHGFALMAPHTEHL